MAEERNVSGSKVQLSQPLDRSMPGDDLARNVYGIFGIPIDAVDLGETLSQIDHAIEHREPFLISTPNVNFLVTSWTDGSFRDALLTSDLCPPDGMPLVWIARLLKIPIKTRVAGSDVFSALKKMRGGKVRRPKVFLFGGGDGLARAVCDKLNSQPHEMRCVGAISPGFGTIEEMSHTQIIKTINQSGADFLAVFLSAKKAQSWLLRNHDWLTVPVRGQFGATINFEAGTVKRAPDYVRSLGFEWLWRIKEEPYLWSRYFTDGTALLLLLLRCVLPLYVGGILNALRPAARLELQIRPSAEGDRQIVSLSGDATAEFIDHSVRCFRSALDSNKNVEIDLSNARYLDQRYFGLLLMVRKQLIRRGKSLSFSKMPAKVRRKFILNRFDFLLNAS
jgi:N-acetylglucosaminyldiphosphoundecaprenol N-acetyl-beta-D-mannosaminyltransferase